MNDRSCRNCKHADPHFNVLTGKSSGKGTCCHPELKAFLKGRFTVSDPVVHMDELSGDCNSWEECERRCKTCKHFTIDEESKIPMGFCWHPGLRSTFDITRAWAGPIGGRNCRMWELSRQPKKPVE